MTLDTRINLSADELDDLSFDDYDEVINPKPENNDFDAIGVCQTSCPPISCGVSDFRRAGFAFRVQPDGSCGLPVARFS